MFSYSLLNKIIIEYWWALDFLNFGKVINMPKVY